MATSTASSFRKTRLSHAQKSVLAMSRAQYLEGIRATWPADKLYVGVCIFRMDAHSSRPSVLLLRRSGIPEAASYANSPIAPNSPTTTSTTTTTTITTSFSTSPYSRWGRDDCHDKQYQQLDSNNIEREKEREEEMEREYRTRRSAGMWELPGGKVRDGDFCISAAVARRVEEQTGLRVVRVLGALQDVRRVAEVRILDWDDDGVGIFTAGGSSSGNLSVLDGATLTSATGSPGSGSLGGSSGNGYGSGSGSGSSSSWSGGAGGIGGRGAGGFRGSSDSSQSRRSPIHNPQLVLRKEYLQLNYAVLVQNHEDLAVKSSEHDELVWASFSRAEALPMPEELRTVVHQGLAFAGEHLF
ncbi:hypothetical protein F4813DRAFT_400251 [Daldinia decipiens]|uniref:uncharacterized protein n=1 Tax=Daldinia decipiens TaxID=326647 RepID=UPI0020C5A683|nr:uncharacterized protein F4813DRAFT_400251 [Daldinia decipiens]KAI1653217.1 hypothetical protein F4813DRAFT_400251 [Daldinia decipiens]